MWDTDDMDMVGHQAISPDIHGEAGRIFAKPLEIAPVIGFRLEDRLLVMPPLHDVMRVSGEGNAGESCHGISL